ncbi:MAG: signal recognition particle receptor subunit alpha, partial [candidate division WOR-3 bacterium]
MFGLLTDKLTALQRRLRGFGRLGDRELSQSLREIRTILLEADVNYKVVGHFIRSVEAALKEKNVAAS